MGVRIFSKRDFASLSWSHRYSSKVGKPNTVGRKIKGDFVKARKRFWQRVASKVYDSSTELVRPFKQAAALATLLTTAAQYVKISFTPLVINTVGVPARPASDGELIKVAMAQIYGDIDDAWLSGIAKVICRRIDTQGNGSQGGQLEQCISLSLSLEVEFMKQVLGKSHNSWTH